MANICRGLRKKNFFSPVHIGFIDVKKMGRKSHTWAPLKTTQWSYYQRHIGTKRQATQHGCLRSLLGDGYKGIEILYGEEKNILYWAK
jgi:hypothetical protein